MERIKINDLLDDIKKCQMSIEDITFFFHAILDYETDRKHLEYYVGRYALSSKDLEEIEKATTIPVNADGKWSAKRCLEKIKKDWQEIREYLYKYKLSYSEKDFR